MPDYVIVSHIPPYHRERDNELWEYRARLVSTALDSWDYIIEHRPLTPVPLDGPWSMAHFTCQAHFRTRDAATVAAREMLEALSVRNDTSVIVQWPRPNIDQEREPEVATTQASARIPDEDPTPTCGNCVNWRDHTCRQTRAASGLTADEAVAVLTVTDNIAMPFSYEDYPDAVLFTGANFGCTLFRRKPTAEELANSVHTSDIVLVGSGNNLDWLLAGPAQDGDDDDGLRRSMP